MTKGPAGARNRFAKGCAALVAGALCGPVAQAGASVPHVVQPGETLWSIAAQSNLTTRTVAAFNGLSEDATVLTGQTINVPTVDEGAAALASAGITPGSAPADSGGAGGHVVVAGESLSSVAAAHGVSVENLASANGLAADAYLIEGQTVTIPEPVAGAVPGLAAIPSPHGDLYLDPGAASSWNSMRQDSIANLGVDLYPAGPVSAYRTAEQQGELYQDFLSGEGPPANPPGTSSHESGVAVDVADPAMRDAIDKIGPAYGWFGTIPSEWWHVAWTGGG